MLVKYDRPNVWGIGIAGKSEKGRPLSSKLVKLQPGINKIDDSDWSKVKSHPHVKRALDAGFLTVVTDKDGSVDKALEVGEARELFGMKAKEAVAIVKGCMRKDLLLKWKGEDERSTVQVAITGQLEKLKPGYVEEEE